MARKRCCGIIDQEPCCLKFYPEKQTCQEPVIVQMEELEAIRLKDIAGLDQADCAASMGISRATFQRILRSAHFKVATALLGGQQIIITGGNYLMRNRVFECLDCGKNWEEEPCSAGGRHGYEIACPSCGSMQKSKVDEDGNKTACGGGHQHHGQGGCCGGHKHGEEKQS